LTPTTVVPEGVPVPTADPVERMRLQRFVLGLGAALNDAGEPAHVVQERLSRVARAYGADSARIFAFPTYLMIALDPSEPATIELTGSLAASPRLDRLAALDELVLAAEDGTPTVTDGLRRLDAIAGMPDRHRGAVRILGYAVLATGLCLILHPAVDDVAAAAVLGALVGLLRQAVGRLAPLHVLLPIIAAFAISALAALAVDHELLDQGLPAVVAALVVFIPGATLTTAILEVASGQAVSGSSRLIAGLVQLAMLALGIVAGIEATGVSSALVLTGNDAVLGAGANWAGVVVFAIGVAIAYSAPRWALPGLVIVLLAAWGAQVLGNEILGGYLSGFVGAAVMTPVAHGVGLYVPRAMPPRASFLPGFWLLVPGALGLVGLTQVAGDAGNAGVAEIAATVVSIFSVALGVLAGTLLVEASTVVGRRIGRRRSDRQTADRTSGEA